MKPFRIWGAIRALSLGSAVAFAAAAALAQTSFDTPLTEFERISGGEVRIAIAGVGTGEGAHTFEIDVPGDPLVAWLYWSGETTEASNPDPEVTLSGGALTAPLDLAGVEIGRRYEVPPDEAATKGGEVVSRADVPLYAIAPGVNTFTIQNFNDVVNNARPYRVQHGVVMVVIYQIVPGDGDWEAIGLQGADIANYDRWARTFDYSDQANSEVFCFDFEPLGCQVQGNVSLGIGGVLEDVHTVAGSTRVAYASPERTWFATGSGPKPTTLIDLYQVLEENKIIDADFGFKGEKLGVFSTAVDLPEGATWACLQHQMLEKKSTDEFAQNFTTFFAGLHMNRSCRPPGQCALDLSMEITPPDVIVPETECDGALTRVSFEYTGQGCEASTHQQAHNAHCSGAAAFEENVRIEMTRIDGTLIDSVEGVMLGDVVTFDARRAGLDHLGRTIRIEIFDSLGNSLETNKIRLKCEKKFNIGDQFGSLLALAYDTTQGTTRDLRTATTVSYTVTNNGDGDTGELTVNDDLLGEVGYASNLAPGESITFTADTTTWKQTRFDANATGEWNCQASAAAVQTFSEPPDDGGLECEGGMKSITLTYTGESCDVSTNDQNGKMRCKGDALMTDPVKIRVRNRKGRKLVVFRDVLIGDTFTLSYADLAPAPRECGKRAKRKRERRHKRRLPSNLVFQIIDQSTGERLQGIKIHTSCSEPVAQGDQFGSLQLESIESRR